MFDNDTLLSLFGIVDGVTHGEYPERALIFLSPHSVEIRYGLEQARHDGTKRTRVNGVGAYSTLISDQAVVGVQSAIFCEPVPYVLQSRSPG